MRIAVAGGEQFFLFNILHEDFFVLSRHTFASYLAFAASIFELSGMLAYSE